MPGLRKTTIAKRLAGLIDDSGARIRGSRFQESKGSLPWECTIRFPSGAEREYTMYFWTVSHGGRGRPDDEYRIQTTLKGDNKLVVEDGTTLLLGYFEWALAGLPAQNSDKRPVIVAWDALNHLTVGNSSSCQVKLGLIKEARRAGVAAYKRSLADGTPELVVATRYDYFPRYLIAAAGGHRSATVEEIRESSYVRRQLQA